MPRSRPRVRRRLPLGPLGVTAIVAVLGVAFALTTGREQQVAEGPIPEASGRGSERRTGTSFLSQLLPPAPDRVRGPRVPRSLADLARRMPLERAVAQLFVLGFEGQDADAAIISELRRLDLGGVVLQGRNYRDPQQLAALTGELGAVARAAGHVPPWVFAEQDGGEWSQFADLPPARAPGKLGSPAEAAAAYSEGLRALHALGVNAVLGPPLDVRPGEEAGVLGTLALRGRVGDVAAYGAAVARTCTELRILCAAKHFPGLGAASDPTDEGPGHVGLSTEQLGRRDIVPFRRAIAAGLRAVLVSHGLYDVDDFVTPGSLSRRVIGDLLRGQARFRGIAVTDDLADPGVSAFAAAPDAAVRAARAGADLLWISGPLGEQLAAHSAVLDAVRAGTIDERRLRRSVLRVLVAKRALGLVGEDARPAARPGAGPAEPGTPAAAP